MDVRRLPYLLELSRLGSMAAVAEQAGVTTSSVSQHLATLAREVGTPLLEPDGRRVRLTPAGHRLAEHAVTILAAVEAARLGLDPDAEPEGLVRVAGFATGIARAMVPIVNDLAESHPGVSVRLNEYEPIEAHDLLTADDVDLALTYDFTLAPLAVPRDCVASPLWEVEWGIGLPARERDRPFAAYADRHWITDSRNAADEEVLRVLGSLVGFAPRVEHRIDSLELVEELIVAGLGIGLLPRGRPTRAGVRVRRLTDPQVLLRAYAVTRRGREQWPPLRLVLDRLRGNRVSRVVAGAPPTSTSRS